MLGDTSSCLGTALVGSCGSTLLSLDGASLGLDGFDFASVWKSIV